MKLHQLTPTTTRRKKRLGRGPGSGKGAHTVGRGQKGQKSRSKIPNWFEGGQLPLIRRTPFIKGKGRFKSLKPKPLLITLSQLNKFKENSTVNLQSVIKTLKLNPKAVVKQGVKIVATGKLKKSLQTNLPASATAQKAIKSLQKDSRQALS